MTVTGKSKGTLVCGDLTVLDDVTITGDIAIIGAFAVAGGSLSVGADATAGTITLYPATTVSGTTTITMSDNSGNTITDLNIAAQAGARTITVPDAGASSDVALLVAGQTTPGQLQRADLTEEPLAVYGLPTALFRQATGIPLAATETAGTFNVDVTGNVQLIKGEVSLNETEVSVGNFQFILPPEYVAAGDVSVRIKHKVEGIGTLGACTVDVEAFEQDGNGAIGADLVTTTATTMTGTWATTDFTVTGSGLAGGDILNVVVTTSIQETGTANSLTAVLDGIALLLDVKG